MRKTLQTLLVKAASWVGPGQPSQWPSLSGLTATRSVAGTFVNENLAQNLPAVWACSKFLADSVANLPWSVVKKRADGSYEERPDSPISELLSDPGSDYDFFTIRSVGQSHVGLWGNSYIEIERDGSSRPRRLWILHPSTTWPRVADGANNLIIEDYQVTDNNYTRYVDPLNMIHIRGHSTSALIGQSPVSVARNALGLALALEQYGSKFFANDGKSGGFLMHPGKLSDAARANIAASFGPGGDGVSGQGGLNNAHRLKILEEGMDFKSATISPEDGQFLGTRAFQTAEIARMFGVPLVFIDSSAATAWGSGIEQLNAGFVTWTLAPLVERWENGFTSKLFTARERAEGFRIKLDFNGLLRGSASSRAAYYQSGINAGWLNRNEARRMEGRQAEPGLDEFLSPLNLGAQSGSVNDE